MRNACQNEETEAETRFSAFYVLFGLLGFHGFEDYIYIVPGQSGGH
jgi:hypothetical protein